MTMDIYAEEIISQYEHPHNRGRIETASAVFHDNNPVCGDDLTIYLVVKDGVVEDAKFDGVGCAISVASASMLTDFIKGKRLDEIMGMGFETVKSVMGIDPGPARLKCATLPLKAAKKALFLYEHKKVDADTDAL